MVCGLRALGFRVFRGLELASFTHGLRVEVFGRKRLGYSALPKLSTSERWAGIVTYNPCISIHSKPLPKRILLSQKAPTTEVFGV